MSQEGGQKRVMRSSIICILLNEVIRMMMRLAGHVARIGEIKTNKFLLVSLKRRSQSEHLGVDGRWEDNIKV
jgi:hypothetical protein